jgi:formamidopyrimidine-DNA glycosylase
VPELPEIEAHAERLTAGFAGTVLERFEPLSFAVLKTAALDPGLAVGAVLTGVGRRGKHLLAGFADPEDPSAAPVTFVVHLMQGGRLVPDEKLAARPRAGLARWRFAQGPSGAEPEAPALLLTEAGSERKAGVWVLSGDPLAQEPLVDLGPDADRVDLAELTALVAEAPNQRVHGFLRDQHVMAGLGRMLANEVCHRAKLSPFAMTAKLSDAQVAALHAAIQACVADALAHERTLPAMSRSADRPGAVHRRKGSTCPVCGDTIRAVEYRSYEVDYCPRCQTDGRILADNTTSKFLK